MSGVGRNLPGTDLGHRQPTTVRPRGGNRPPPSILFSSRGGGEGLRKCRVRGLNITSRQLSASMALGSFQSVSGSEP